MQPQAPNKLDVDGNCVAISTTLTLNLYGAPSTHFAIGLNNGLIPTDESLEKIYVFGVVPSLTPEGKCIFKGVWIPINFQAGILEHLAPKHALVVAQNPEPNHKWLKMVLSKRNEGQLIPRSETSPYFKEWRERVSQMDLSSGAAAALIEFVDYGTLEEPNKSPTFAMELFITGSKFQFPELELEVKNLLLRKPTSWFDAASLQVYCQGVNLDQHQDLQWRLAQVIITSTNENSCNVCDIDFTEN
ncbi:hypothetical protein Ocin01_08571 [Orchesella cincta]|uniref:Uncharacterized protein n=1 Tax=Orchesella cincta TaxID=48709 RepID=A0A1D2MZN7_ORCCI|nr:hypothetical protein Ocin01_08571 [Orchesella cincta]